MKPTVLCILDGWGDSPKLDANAVQLGKTPNFDSLRAHCPSTQLSASGTDVGLPAGQIGNSEVGHLNLGAGRLVLQTLPRISKAMTENSIPQMPVFKDFCNTAKTGSKRIHLLGLMSPGGVHSHVDHLVFMVKALKAEGFQVFVHAFADGRDGPAKEILKVLPLVEKQIGQPISTLMGRYYAMDRDNRWERTKLAFDTLVNATVDENFGQKRSSNFATDVQTAYDEGTTDEFLKGFVDPTYEGMKDGDSLITVNFRADRMRQILDALVDPNFEGFEATPPKFAANLGMVSYSNNLDRYLPALFLRDDINNTIGELVANAGLSQIRAAETEKYPHVTYFLNGGREEPFEGEHRLMVNSPKVATYDLQPEMSAPELIKDLLTMMADKEPALVVVNFANPDMVGHTGSLPAAIKAVEAVDDCLGQLADFTLASGGNLVVIADHGNCETMMTEDGKPHTAHTLNPVPMIVGGYKGALKDGGKLADVAPTILALMGIDQPTQMDGQSLLNA
ncbi:MAG: 2,3-bisphosphoglycerate-independent phosphoglycerate mutase [Alphaproteobacteria bacterium]